MPDKLGQAGTEPDHITRMLDLEDEEPDVDGLPWPAAPAKEESE